MPDNTTMFKNTHERIAISQSVQAPKTEKGRKLPRETLIILLYSAMFGVLKEHKYMYLSTE